MVAHETALILLLLSTRATEFGPPLPLLMQSVFYKTAKTAMVDWVDVYLQEISPAIEGHLAPASSSLGELAFSSVKLNKSPGVS